MSHEITDRPALAEVTGQADVARTDADAADQTAPGNRREPPPRSKRWIPALIVFALGLPVCWRLVFLDHGPNGETTDHKLHIGLALDILRKKELPPHPLFHGLLLLLIGGDNEPAARGVAAAILAAALGVRAYLTAGALATSRHLSTLVITLLCIGLAVAMPLPNWWDWPNVCRGQVAANAWYNPTGIFAMPFALGLFLLGMRVLDGNGSGPFAALSVVMLFSLLAKPNYVLAFVPCFGVMLAAVLYQAVREGRLSPGAALAKACLAFAPSAALLAWQYFNLYGGDDPAGGRLLYVPLEVWKRFTKDHVAAAIYLGIAFPAAATLLFPLQANRDRGLVLAWSVTAVGIIQFALFAESGSRITHANLSWGMMLAAHVLFVVSCAFLLQQKGLVRKCLAFGVLGAHVLSGSMCLVRSLNEPWNAICF
jgi:hypothetical protein